MRTIEITTTQNVTIEYELAILRDRIIAFLLDSLILWGIIFILSMVNTFAFSYSSHMKIYIEYLVISPIFIFYSLFWELIWNGQSPGKKALGIKVIKLNGTEATLGDYLLRWTFRIVDIYFSFGAVASMLVSSTDKSQRIGDLVANTTVVRLKPQGALQLNDLLKINSIENYTPVYPNVKKMNEPEMLLVKTALERFKRYPNESHKKAITELVEEICQRLDITETPKDKLGFLRTVINDYIVLTR